MESGGDVMGYKRAWFIGHCIQSHSMSADSLAASNAGSWAGSLSELWVWCV